MAAAAPIFAGITKLGATLLGGGAASAAGGTAAAGAATGAGVLGTAAKIATIGAAGLGARAALQKPPKMPGLPDPLPMPDQPQIEAARRRRIAGERQMAGVASTLLGGGAGGTLG